MTGPDPGREPIVLETLELHAAGEPLRVILSGYPELPGATMLEKRAYAREHLDHLRTALMFEPRGHADMYGCVLTEPVTPDGDLGVLFLHNEGYSTMCGHAVIALTTAVFQEGIRSLPEDRTELRLDTPAGRVVARPHRAHGRVSAVSFRNVPSFVAALDQTVEVPGHGAVSYDLAFGGAFYAVCRAVDLGVELRPGSFRALIDAGMAVKHAVMAQRSIEHPFEADLGFLYGTILVGPPEDPVHHSRNVCVFAEGEVDRSPTGTGVSARAAIHHARGELAVDESFTVESILGTCFTGTVREPTRFGPHAAVVPEVQGHASVVGRCRWTLDPDDPLVHGFLLR